MGGQISIHALREEGDGSGFSVVEVLCLFLSTPSARRATPYQQYCINRIVISIHALREEGDAALWPARLCWRYFYPRPPRGGRRPSAARRQTDPQFLSTPSARRATCLDLRQGWNQAISIHALREEGDSTHDRHKQYDAYFYPRPPRGGRLVDVGSQAVSTHISIHALREEGDAAVARADTMDNLFLSTPSARRATWHRTSPVYSASNFYPRPPRGGRQQKRRKTSPLLFHYKTICTDLEELF